MNKLIIISALWCPSCLVMSKYVKKLQEEMKDIKIEKLDYDFDDIEEYNVGKKLPVLILVDENNNEIARTIGEKNYQEIIEFIKEN